MSLMNAERVRRMFNNPKFADVKIVIGDVDVPAHRFVLCLQSKYFDDALNGVFVESSTRTLRCPPQKEHAYLRVLQYLYTGDYEDVPSNLIADEGITDLIEMHTKVG